MGKINYITTQILKYFCQNIFLFRATAIGLNSAAAVIMVDFIKPFYKKPMTEMRESFYMKLIIVIFGIITTLSTYIVDKLGTLVQVIV